MSSLVVPVATIDRLDPHPNAETLDLAQVLGWQMVVKKGQFKEGDKVVYIPIDTVLPLELSDKLGVTQYLSKQRVKNTRLRGEPSFGLALVPDQDWPIGENVAEYYGVTKYEPPVRASRGGFHQPNEFAVPRHPLFVSYTDIENLRNFPGVLSEGEWVVVTEKIHGTNSRVGMVEGEWMAGSHRVQRGPNDELYWSPRERVEGLVEALAGQHKQVIVFGEIYGSAVQSLNYCAEGYNGYRVFDIMVDGRYLDYHTMKAVADLYGVLTVPLYYEGMYSLETVRSLSEGKTTICGEHIREGVVVKPVVERSDPKVGRVILKYISDDYLFLKNKTDYQDV